MKTVASILAESNFYYYQGVKIPLMPVIDKILVCYKQPKSKSDILNILQDQKLGDMINVKNSTQDLDQEGTNRMVVHLNQESKSKLETSSIENAFTNIDIAYISPFFRVENETKTFLGLTNQVIIKIFPDQSIEQYKELLQQYDIQKTELMPFSTDTYLLTIGDNSTYSALDISNALSETNSFEYATPNFFRIASQSSFNVNDPLFSSEWYVPLTRTNDAWCFTQGANIKIAILDVAILTTHPDLAANMLSGYDPTGHPFGYDAHGTGCAGCAAAVGNNGIGGAGMAFASKIIPIRVGYKPNSDPNDTSFHGEDAWLINGVNYAWNTSAADILSCSFDWGSQSSAITNAFTSALNSGRGNKGCPVFASTGNANSTTVGYPATILNVTAIGSSSANDTRSAFSNYGNDLDFVAPGENIVTTSADGGYMGFTGTSAAAPVTAGIAALMLSINPSLTRLEIFTLMAQACEKVGGYSYSTGKPYSTWNNEMGYGRINSLNLLLSWYAITGPNYLCSGTQTTFSIANLPSNAVVNWSSAPGININSYTGAATAQPGYNDRITVTANVSINNGCFTFPLTKAVPVGAVQAECFGNATISNPPFNSWAASYNGAFYLKNNNGQTISNTIRFGYAPSIGKTTSIPPASGETWGTIGITGISIVSQPSGWTGTYISGNSLSVYCNNASGVLGVNLTTPCGVIFCRFQINGI